MSQTIRVLTIVKSNEKLQHDYLPYVQQGGMFLKTDDGYEIGDDMLLFLTSLDDHQSYIAFGQVVWVDAPDGRTRRIGIEFRELGSGAKFVKTQQPIPRAA